MFLGFDIGNTNTKMGIYHDGSPEPLMVKTYRTVKNSNEESLSGEIKNALSSLSVPSGEIRGIAFSSVVPEINMSYGKACRDLFGIRPLLIDHRCTTKITISYDNPSSLGPDRIVNAEAAFIEYGSELIIIDIGTAATFCVISKDCFVGGLIAPGIELTKKALADNTSNLPEIIFERPDRLIARDTVNAVKSGFFYGWLMMVSGIIDLIENEYKRPLKIIFTGGYSKIISENIRNKNIFDPHLTMKGIKYIYEQNKVIE